MKLKKKNLISKEMKTEISKILSLGKFFQVTSNKTSNMTYVLQPSSTILIDNIYISWLRSINARAQSHFPVYLSAVNKKDLCYGFIEKMFDKSPKVIERIDRSSPLLEKSKLNFTLIVPKQDVMQYFFQWQRYRKYWWSSITTTPSLFMVNDMKYEASTVNTQIVANFEKGQNIVEHLSMSKNMDSSESASISCCMSMETALVTLLLDGMSNQNKDGYLRLHYKMAPYKISFALNTMDNKTFDTLKELAAFLHNKITLAQIKSLLPTFSHPLQLQIEENLKIGVPYTAILNEETLTNGIFHLLNSSTMLKEQVHVADFEEYASLLFS
ncbi:DNA polymerase subunit gamma-2, mitochondrial [Pieris brassicae]|nr:DNA polymerase subunit gamma-2, mitochondrial [Pieris brassicae]